jgi:hypothetical protein
VPVNAAPATVDTEKRMKDLEKLLGDSRKSWTARLKAIEEDVLQLKELYGRLSDNSDADKCFTTAKTAGKDATCGGSRVSLDKNDPLLIMRLLFIVIEELKKRATDEMERLDDK